MVLFFKKGDFNTKKKKKKKKKTNKCNKDNIVLQAFLR